MPKRSVKDTAIIAPGGGTREDVTNLARDLGMDYAAVLEVMNYQGAGVRVSRSSIAAAASSGASSAYTTTSMNNTWAEFMSEEGVGVPKVDSTENTTTVTKRTKTSSPMKAPSSSRTKTVESTTMIPSTHRYNLPIPPLMRIQTQDKATKTGATKSFNKEEKEEGDSFPTPGLLAQTGTLESSSVGRKKSNFSSLHDLMEPTLLGYVSIFNKLPIALIATSSSACHSIVIDIHGNAYSWGRNETGQCGNTHGSFSPCVPVPKRISWEKSGDEEGKFIGAAVGKSHSVLISTSGHMFGVGSNKVGQCGVNTTAESIPNWKKCTFVKDSSNDRDSIKVVQVCIQYNLSSIEFFTPLTLYQLLKKKTIHSSLPGCLW